MIDFVSVNLAHIYMCSKYFPRKFSTKFRISQRISFKIVDKDSRKKLEHKNVLPKFVLSKLINSENKPIGKSLTCSFQLND